MVMARTCMGVCYFYRYLIIFAISVVVLKVIDTIFYIKV